MESDSKIVMLNNNIFCPCINYFKFTHPPVALVVFLAVADEDVIFKTMD